MKAAPFDYRRADNLSDALALLTQFGGEAKLIAGGQSLVPMMSMRLARPSMLIDIHRLEELQLAHMDHDRFITGAGVRQCNMEQDLALTDRLPLVAQALRWVGHDQTRNRGTVGGSLVHADPSAELPLAAVTLDATVVLRNLKGERRVQARDFFLGPMFTGTAEDECLTSIEWPQWSGPGVGSAFEEFAIRHGDFAMAAGAAQLQLDGAGACVRAVLGIGGVHGVPLALPELAKSLVGKHPTDEMLRAIATDAARSCEPGNDIHASAGYRRHLVTVLVERVLRQALVVARNH